jgi:hypothetical protein
MNTRRTSLATSSSPHSPSLPPPPSLNSVLSLSSSLAPSAFLTLLSSSRYNLLHEAYLSVLASLAAYSASFSTDTSSTTMQTQLLTLVDPLQVFLDCEVSLNVAFRTLYS